MTIAYLDSFAQNIKNYEDESRYRVFHWTLYDGLANAVTSYMRKDVKGFIWIGTNNGLSRFEGSLFKNYYHDPHDSRTIAGTFIFGIIEDSLHNIWIGTDRGLSRYDIKADTFRNFKPAGSTDFFSAAFSATRDRVFTVEQGGIYGYDVHTFEKKKLAVISETDSVGNGLSFPYTVYDSSTNSIWMLRGSRATKEDGLLNISLSNGKRKVFALPGELKPIPVTHFSEAMRFDRGRNSIWINSVYGLLEFSLNDKQFHGVAAMKSLTKIKDYSRFVGIDLDLQGRVWIATHPKGIFIYDPRDQSLKIPFPEDSLAQNNVSDANAFIYCDRDGIVWSGYWLPKGIYQLNPFRPAVKLYIPNPDAQESYGRNAVIDFQNAGFGKIRINAVGGNYLFDPHTGQIKLFHENYAGQKNNEFSWLTVLDSNSGKALYMTRNNKILALDLKTRKTRQIIFKDSLNNPVDSMEIFFVMPLKTTWIVQINSHDKQFIYEFNWDNAEAREILKIPNNNNWIFTTTDGEHLLFLKRGEEAGNLTYSYSNGKFLQIQNPTNNIQWTSIFFDRKDMSYWVAGDRQLFHYDGNFNLMHVFTGENGLPDNDLVGLIGDNMGNIWFHTDHSIHQLNVETGEVSTLSERDGFEKQDFDLLKFNFKDENGYIYFPGGGPGKGFDRINPSKFTSPPSTIYLQSIKINQRPFSLITGVNNLQLLTLGHSENNITLETGIIDFYSKGNSHMRYKLETEGSTAGWQYGPANYTIRFADLQPGNYKLHMQASNAALQFNGPEKILEINIAPPWWQTWWARSLIILAFVFSLWSFIQYRSRNLKKRNLELEEKVMHRTKELKHSLEDLRTTQTQLIQREKMASLGELTAGIAHEIQNPLNFINNFSDINTELIDEMKHDIKSGNMQEGLEVADTIMENNLKIINHGKRADSIVKGMLLHSRQSSGQQEPASINLLADEYLRLSYHGVRAKDKTFNATIHTDFDDQIGLVNMVPQDIGRVFLNLFNNSFYAIAEKRKMQTNGYEPTIDVSTEKKGQVLEIKIKDNGPGIPRKFLDKIFQPFFTTKPTGEGTGLGLSLSYEIITKGHGGTIHIDTKEGEFTEFIITLPITNNS